LGLLIYNNYFTFIFQQALLVLGTFYLLYKMYGKNSYLLFFSTALFGFYAINPTYNFMCFFLMILLIYLEKKYSSKDYLIGFIIGLSILSKHTVGAFFVLPTLIFYYKDIRKLLRRFIGLIIPCFIFLIYLICNNSLYQFFNLCVMGLFDFSSNNGNIQTIYFYYTIICFIISLIVLFKNKKDISNYYLIFSIMFTIPLFDINHFGLYFNSIIIMLFPYINIKNKWVIPVCILSTYIYMVISLKIGCTYKINFMKKLNHFQYTLHVEDSYKNILNRKNYVDKYNDSIVLSSFSFIYHISSDQDITYYDVFLYGNFGYNGNSNLIKEINSMHNKYFIIDMNDYNNESVNCQFNKEIADYIMDNYSKVDSKYNLNVYYKE
jgi:hypothetical protein